MAEQNGVSLRVQTPMQPIGTPGLLQWGGYVREELLQDLTGPAGMRVYKKMRDNSAIIGAILFAVEMLLRPVGWSCTPADDSPEADDLAAFAQHALFEDCLQPWATRLSDILSMLPFGWALCEWTLKRRQGPTRDPWTSSQATDGMLGFADLGLRSQDSLLQWLFNDRDEVTAMMQQPPAGGPVVTIPRAKTLLFRPLSYKSNPEGRSILRNAYRCFSSDTELLTRAGWKNVLLIDWDDELATLHPTTQTLEYQHPTELHQAPYCGDLMHITGQSLDQLVTPNHRLYVKRAHLEHYEFIEAADVRPSVQYACTAEWQGQEQSTHRIPEYVYGPQMHGGARTLPAIEIPMDDWLRFLGIFIAEGHTYRDKQRNKQAYVGITQKDGKKLEVMRSWMQKLGLNIREYENPRGLHRLEISSVQLWHALVHLGKALTKHVPAYVKELSPRQINLFLEAFHLGDGTTVVHSEHSTTPLYYTGSSRLADDLSELLLKVGTSSSVRWQTGTNLGQGVYVIVARKTPKQGGYRASSYRWVPYDGLVGCVTVPNGIVYARRHGKPCWSGNSWYNVTHIENIEGIGIERDLAGLPVVKVPPELLAPDAPPATKALYETYKRLATNIRRDEQEGIVFPLVYDAEGNELYKLELLSTGGRRQFDTDAIIQRYDLRIAQSVLADMILVGHEQVGSYALASSKTNLFATALGGYLDSIGDTFQHEALPVLWQVNGLPLELMPHVSHGDVEHVDAKELSEAVKNLAQAGFMVADLERPVRLKMGLPAPEEEEMA